MRAIPNPLVILFFVVVWLTGLSAAQAQRVTFQLTASQPHLIADGKSTCEITVRIDDPSVPEGTTVHFTSSLEGTVIEPQATLRRGVARVRLRAGTTPGVTTVTAFFGTSREMIEIQLLPPGVEASREAQVIVMEGDYVAYAPQLSFVAGSGKVRLVYRGWEVQSDVRLDFWLHSKIVVAEGQPGMNRVVVTNGKTRWEGDRFIADMERQIGVLTKVVPEAKRTVVKGWALTEGTETDAAGLTEPTPPTDPNLNWIRGRSLEVYSDKRLVIRRAQIYMQAQKLISLPLYVEAQSGYARAYSFGSPLGLQGLSMTAYGGLQLDAPIYYRADAKGLGALRLQYFGQGFGYLRPGLTLSLEEQYVLGKRGDVEGGVYLEQITRPDWGIRWQHFQRLGNGSRLNLFMDMPRHKDLFARLSYHGDVGNIGLGIEANLQKPEGMELSHGIYAYTYLPGGMLGKSGMSYTLSGGVAWQPSRGVGPTLSWGMDANLNFPSLKVGRQGQMTSQFGLSLLSAGGSLDLPWQFNAMLNYPVGRMGNLNLSYNLDKGRSFWSTGGFVSESLSLSLFLRPGSKWQVWGMGTLNLRGGGRFHSLYFTYSPRPSWRVVLELTQQGYQGFNYTDYGIRLIKSIGSGVDVSLNWSKSRRRIFLEIGALQF